jgi:hypothetical protein
MKKLLLRTTCVLFGAFALAAAWDVATYDAKAWQADLDRLEGDMAQGYANLDWIASKRGLDLVRLDRETRARIDSAHSRLFALIAVRDFVHAFRDPHLKLEWGKRPIIEAAPIAPVSAPEAKSTATVDGSTGGLRLRRRWLRGGRSRLCVPVRPPARLARARWRRLPDRHRR